VSVIDALYYVTVTPSTTGYGDITGDAAAEGFFAVLVDDER
jgi:hypothetical protein